MDVKNSYILSELCDANKLHFELFSQELMTLDIDKLLIVHHNIIKNQSTRPALFSLAESKDV
jgi:hypothetical protein